MSNPKHTLFWMTVYLLIVATVCALIYEPISAAFMANWVFNSLILAVLVIGTAFSTLCCRSHEARASLINFGFSATIPQSRLRQARPPRLTQQRATVRQGQSMQTQGK